VSTFAQRLRYANRARSVARFAAVQAFDEWLSDASAPPVLGVFGPGGVGKSWLLQDLAHRAEERSAHVWLIEADHGSAPILPPVPAAIAGSGRHRLLLIDGLDALPAGGAALVRELADLDDGVRVVLASRRPLVDGPWRAWAALTRPLELSAFGPEECDRYLDLRGVDDPRTREQILFRSGGHPLTLSLAADLLLSPDSGEWSETPAWSATVSSTVEQLLADVGGTLREAVRAAAVLGRCDQDLLTAVLGAPMGARAFVRLCGLSVTRAIGDEVALHDEVRAVVLEDLRLHHPKLLDALRRRALRQLRRHPGGHSAATIAARRGGLHLLGRDLPGLSALPPEDGELIVEVADERAIDEILELRARVPAVPGLPRAEHDPDLLRQILADRGCEVHLARDGAGALRGYAFHLCLTPRSARLLDGDGMPGVLAAVLDMLGTDGDFPERSNIFFLSTIVTPDDDPRAVHSALSNSVVDLMLKEGAYLMLPVVDSYRELVRTLRAERVARRAGMDPASPEAWLLDLSRCGVEGWARAVGGGGDGRLPLADELTAVVVRALSDLDDDQALAASPLAVLAEPDDDRDVAARAAAVRELLSRALTADGAWPAPDLRVRDALRSAGVEELPEHGSADTAELRVLRAEPLRLQLLGDFVLRRGEVSVPIAEGVLSRLVKIVALRGRLPVDELVEWLWPYAAAGVGRERLRTALSRLRRLVGPDLVVREGGDIVLGHHVSVDATRFREQAPQALRNRAGPMQFQALFV
jgi:hypothetical protein